MKRVAIKRMKPDGARTRQTEPNPTPPVTLEAYQKKRNHCLSVMGGEGPVPKELCHSICWNLTVWLRQNQEVHARKDANRLQKGRYGWELPLGENRFGVALAVTWSRNYLATLFKPDEIRSFALTMSEVRMIEHFARSAVIGHGDQLFQQTYPLDANRKMWFGTHAVVIPWFSNALIHFAGLTK